MVLPVHRELEWPLKILRRTFYTEFWIGRTLSFISVYGRGVIPYDPHPFSGINRSWKVGRRTDSHLLTHHQLPLSAHPKSSVPFVHSSFFDHERGLQFGSHVTLPSPDPVVLVDDDVLLFSFSFVRGHLISLDLLYPKVTANIYDCKQCPKLGWFFSMSIWGSSTSVCWWWWWVTGLTNPPSVST